MQPITFYDRLGSYHYVKGGRGGRRYKVASVVIKARHTAKQGVRTKT